MKSAINFKHYGTSTFHFLTMRATILTMRWVPVSRNLFGSTKFYTIRGTIYIIILFGVKITVFFFERRVSKRLRLFIIKSFNMLKRKFKVFCRCKMLRKITRKVITEVHRVYQKMWQNSFKQIEMGGTYVSIRWWSVCHYKEAVFQF